MARLQLNKSSLAHQAARLKTYERFLPSLDLKRQQLMAERAKARKALGAIDAEIDGLYDRIAHEVPMLGNDGVALEHLAKLEGYELGSENVVGIELPVLDRVDVAVRPYSALAKPHWVDDVASLLHDMLEARARAFVARRRLALLDDAVATVTQRLNLFDKVLIPTTRANIKKIRVYLNDQELASVVRSKIAKRKRVGR